MFKLPRLLAALLPFFVLVLTGCPVPPDDDDATANDDDAAPDDDDTTANDDDAAPDDDDTTANDDDAAPDDDDTTADDDDAVDDDDAADDDDDSPPSGEALLGGVITRSADLEHDGLGDLYVAIFDGNPVDLVNTPNVLATHLLPATDLTDPTTQIAYAVAVVPSGDLLHVMAFFDDNGNVDVSVPGPDQSDLVSLEGLAAPTVVVASDDGGALDLDLNFAMPF